MNPTDLLIRSMENLDDVGDVLVIRRHKDGCISFESALKSRFDAYAMVCSVKATIESLITVTEISE